MFFRPGARCKKAKDCCGDLECDKGTSRCYPKTSKNNKKCGGGLNTCEKSKCYPIPRDMKALCRRIDVIVPFLPFTKAERKVVADIAVRE